VKRQLTGLAVLAVDRQHTVPDVEVVAVEAERLAEPHPGHHE
jgi:hypothetical protein